MTPRVIRIDAQAVRASSTGEVSLRTATAVWYERVMLNGEGWAFEMSVSDTRGRPIHGRKLRVGENLVVQVTNRGSRKVRNVRVLIGGLCQQLGDLEVGEGATHVVKLDQLGSWDEIVVEGDPVKTWRERLFGWLK